MTRRLQLRLELVAPMIDEPVTDRHEDDASAVDIFKEFAEAWPARKSLPLGTGGTNE